MKVTCFLLVILSAVSAVTFGFEISAAQQPDIIVQAVNLSPALPAVGDTIRFSVYFGNNAPVPTASTFDNCFQIDGVQIECDYVGLIDPNSPGHLNEFYWTANSAGTHTVMVDAYNNVGESNEQNNVFTATFNVVDDVCSRILCPEGTTCVNGQCVDACSTIFCPEGTTCVNGRCVDTCSLILCGPEQKCENGRCVPIPETPWPILLLVVTLAIAVVGLRRRPLPSDQPCIS